MAKRGLCILLAVLTVFALAVPAFAAEGGAVVNEPKAAAATSGFCGANVKWSLSSGGTLTISGTGKMKDYSYGNEAPWYSEDDLLQSSIKKVVIKPGVTSIGNRAFLGCSSMTSVTIPDTVTTIGEQAFWTCSALKSVKIPNSVTSIEFGAFLSCGLTSLTIPDSLTTIGDSVFDGCDMTSLTIPDSVTSIGNYAFQHCSSLKSVTIPDSVKSIGAAAFQYDTSMTSVTIPSSVTSIGDWAFVGCTSLKSVTIKNPKCKLGALITLGNGIIHYGYDGSTAEVYAKESGYTFKSLNLAAPKLSKVASTDGGVKISWGKVSGAAKYRVYYKGGDAKSWTKIADTTSTSYTWTKAKAGTNYSFTVKAYDKQGVAGKYDKTGVSLIANKNLTAPTVKIAQTDGGIQVTWNAVSGSSRYMVYYKENGGSWQKIGDTAKTSYTRASSKLKNGATYQFAVRCCASDGKTLLSSYKASNKVKYTVELAAPTVKIAQTSGGIQVTWNAVSGSSRYMVYYKENGGSWQRIGDTAKTSYTRAAKYLKAGATYQFTVRCCASDGKTLLSSYKASNKVKYTVELAAPTVKIAQTSGGIQVTWNAVSGSSRYMVYYKENDGSWQKIGTTAKTSYTRAAKYLKAGATYQFTVRCCAADGKTLLSAYQASNKVTYTK